ncbi:hypothetical protein Moror_17633 [Moniliophthora roreri MCA 2997]|uniref:Uncharacterized protein n=2 Tax=Moniliophthora roreri TaxID=221103 RepID=V2Z0E9_MONRO|nr:hypothetical protein Moror_17633 [Moniliophthora roreri MCA 2997]
MDDLNSMQVVLNWGRSWRLHIEFSDNYHVPDSSFPLLSHPTLLPSSVPSGPNNPVPGEQAQIVSVSSPNDAATFTLFLLDANNTPFGLKQDFGEFQTADGGVTVTLNANLPTNLEYVFLAVNTTCVDFVYGSSPRFRLRLVLF